MEGFLIVRGKAVFVITAFGDVEVLFKVLTHQQGTTSNQFHTCEVPKPATNWNLISTITIRSITCVNLRGAKELSSLAAFQIIFSIR